MTDKPYNEESPVEKDIFDQDVSTTVQTIVLLRIYDMLTVIARSISRQEADYIFAGHAQGKIFGPAPSFDMSEPTEE